jgi:putative phage-type endonuclease
VSYSIVVSSSDREAWLAARSTGIGASESAAILGLSSWASPLSVYMGKVDPTPVSDDAEWMRWGLLLERTILEELCRRAGVAPVPGPAHMLRSDEHPWATATPDGMVSETREPIEVKNLAWGYDEEEWAIGIPEHYRLQCQHQMMVTGAQRCIFGALIHGQRLVWEWIPRDEDTIRRIVIAGAEMWRRIQERDAPPSDGHPKDREALARMDRDDNAVELARDVVDPLLTAYYNAREARLGLEKQAKKAKAAEDAAANRIAQAMGAARSAYLYDGHRFEWVTTRRAGYTVESSEKQTFKILEPKGDTK